MSLSSLSATSWIQALAKQSNSCESMSGQQMGAFISCRKVSPITVTCCFHLLLTLRWFSQKELVPFRWLLGYCTNSVNLDLRMEKEPFFCCQVASFQIPFLAFNRNTFTSNILSLGLGVGSPCSHEGHWAQLHCWQVFLVAVDVRVTDTLQS